MTSLTGTPLDSCFLSLSPGLPHSKSQGLIPKVAVTSCDFRKVAVPCICSTQGRISRSPFFVASSVYAGDASSESSDEGGSTVSSSGSSESSSGSSDSRTSSNDSDSGTGPVYPFLPSRHAAGQSGGDKAKSSAQAAMEKAMAYKKSKVLVAGQQVASTFSRPPARPRPPSGGDVPQAEVIAGKRFESSLKPYASPESSSRERVAQDQAKADGGVDTSSPAQQVDNESMSVDDLRKQEEEDSLTEAQEKEKFQEDSRNSIGEEALSAFRKAKAYKQQQAEMVAALQGKETAEVGDPVSEQKSDYLEVEIYTRDGVIKRKTKKPEKAFSLVKEAKRKGVSQLDFTGLGFADKKSSSTPAGLMKGLEMVAPTMLPEVEIITRDGGSAGIQEADAEGSLYKPKVSTWGVFPRPADISKTFGGGRTIRPGESLETEEEKGIREARTRKLLDDYRQKMGLDVDPRMKAASEKELKDGENLMEQGSMREAYAVFQGVLNRMAFQTELHGLAALQSAVCLEAIGRSTDAKLLYEKLITHPNFGVRKKAKQLLFGFQAMDTLKLPSNYNWDSGIYRKYFDSFANGYSNVYKREDEDSDYPLLLRILPYAVLSFPILLIVALAALKRT